MRTIYTIAAGLTLLMATTAMAQDTSHIGGQPPPKYTASDHGAPPEGGPGGPGGQSPHLTQEQKEAIHDCAKKSGVDLPLPSGDGPPKLTDAQRTVVHACFDKLGIKRPPHPPQGGPGNPPPADKPDGVPSGK